MPHTREGGQATVEPAHIREGQEGLKCHISERAGRAEMAYIREGRQATVDTTRTERDRKFMVGVRVRQPADRTIRTCPRGQEGLKWPIPEKPAARPMKAPTPEKCGNTEPQFGGHKLRNTSAIQKVSAGVKSIWRS